jgi:hypothetical protein
LIGDGEELELRAGDGKHVRLSAGGTSRLGRICEVNGHIVFCSSRQTVDALHFPPRAFSVRRVLR